jgi:hypothetical protein
VEHGTRTTDFDEYFFDVFRPALFVGDNAWSPISGPRLFTNVIITECIYSINLKSNSCLGTSSLVPLELIDQPLSQRDICSLTAPRSINRSTKIIVVQCTQKPSYRFCGQVGDILCRVFVVHVVFWPKLLPKIRYGGRRDSRSHPSCGPLPWECQIKGRRLVKMLPIDWRWTHNSRSYNSISMIGKQCQVLRPYNIIKQPALEVTTSRTYLRVSKPKLTTLSCTAYLHKLSRTLFEYRTFFWFWERSCFVICPWNTGPSISV